MYIYNFERAPFINWIFEFLPYAKHYFRCGKYSREQNKKKICKLPKAYIPMGKADNKPINNIY